MSEATMRAQMGTTVQALMDTDPKLAVVLADISSGYFAGAIAAHPLRMVEVGIMEQAAVSVAAGMALEGFVPVVHSITPFVVERPFEQIKDDFCYQRLGGNFISTGASYDYGTDGFTHYGMADVPILRTLPGMEIVVPGTAGEFDALFRAAYADGAPTYFRLATQQNAADRPVRFGKIDVVRRGSRACIIAVGPMLDRVLEAVKDLHVTVLYCTTVAPFDAEALRVETIGGPMAPGASVVLVEPYQEGTLVPEIVAALRPHPVRLEAIGVPRRILSNYGSTEEHDAEVGLTAAGIRARIEAFLGIRPS
ncbi:MAG: transketolase family protein [Candidatus Limnocylindrales bacterium]